MWPKRQMNHLLRNEYTFWVIWITVYMTTPKSVGHLHFVVAVNALQKHCCIGLLFSPAVNSFNYYLLLFICLCSVVYVDFWRLHFMCALTVLIVVVLLCTFVCFPIDCAHDARSTAAQQQQQRSNNNNNNNNNNKRQLFNYNLHFPIQFSTCANRLRSAFC